MKDISNSLDRLMANAPDELPEDQRQPEPPKPKPKEEEVKPKELEGPSQAEQMKKAQEEFYKDPLIQEALKEFEGTIITQ